MVCVAVLVISYNGLEVIGDCLSSVCEATTDSLDVRLFVLDNASRDGTAEFIAEKFPQCCLIKSTENLGFAAGNNLGWKEIERLSPDSDYLFLLNQDTVVDRGFLTNAVHYADAYPEIGAIQSLLLLHPEVDLINTAGNALHYLGFGIPTYYRRPRVPMPPDGQVGYPSGAAVMIRSSLLRKFGRVFHPDLFMYLEDAELGIRLHLSGNPPCLCPSSVVYHKYTFSSTLRSYYYLERNRLWLVAVTYRLSTLLLLLPALALMEAGQLLYAASNGLLSAKLRATGSLLRPRFLHRLIVARREMQSLRVIGDGDLLKETVGTIESPHLDSWLLRHVANPFFAAYLCVLKWVVRPERYASSRPCANRSRASLPN